MLDRYKCLDRLSEGLAQGKTLREALETVKLFRFLILGTEWASGNGGLSTFNRKLCIALAELGHEVVLYLSSTPGSSRADEIADDAEAAKFGVKLVRTQGKWRDVVPPAIKNLKPEFIVGHDRHSGGDAQRLQNDYFPNARNVLFIHTDPAIEMFKGDDPIEQSRKKHEREGIQRALIKNADVVAAVGPRLHTHCAEIVRGFLSPNQWVLIEFIPGFVAREEEPCPELQDGRKVTHKALLIGRAEDAYLKGLDIFQAAVEKLKDENLPTTGTVFGAPIDQISRLYNDEDFGSTGDVLGYSSDPELIGEQFRSSHFALLPSREEGFGLVALETLEANRPVVATERSGFAEWLVREIEERAPHLRQVAQSCVFAAPKKMKGADEEDLLAGWADALAAKLRPLILNYPACVENVRQLREVLQPLNWTFRASEFVNSLPAASKAANLTVPRRGN
ncbi:glycosyltransferase [Roseateles sp. DB2]|uniref:glycosyltransferase family 4 protein n=1 Tax=Roseateles sp. DB2 TaxID=3453717 RepID=UPI003EE9213E